MAKNKVARFVIKKEKIKRIYIENTGWIDKFESDIIIDSIAGEYCYIGNWLINKNISVLRPNISIIEWNIPIESVDEQIEKIEIEIDCPDDEMPF